MLQPSSAGQFYRYAPHEIAQGDDTHTWTCGNIDDGVIVDHIIYRKNDGAESVALSPGADGSWDSKHVCDPHVVAVNFSSAGVQYAYVMFYTGSQDVNGDGTGNHIGTAYATSLEGPWTKLGNALIASSDGWGVGQPSSSSQTTTKKLLFYTEGTSSSTRMLWTVVHFVNPQPQVEGRRVMVTNGLMQTDGSVDSLVRNAQIAYRARDDTFVMTRVAHPFPSDSPNFVASSVQVATIPASDFYGLNGSWTTSFGALAFPDATRTFDPGLRTNDVGQVEPCMKLLASVANASGWPDALWSYRVARADLGGDGQLCAAP